MSELGDMAAFTLARIEDEEGVAQSIVNDQGSSNEGFDRVFANCKAQRRIVELALEAEDAARRNAAYTAAEDYMADALRALVLVHDQDPDFLEEWRP